MTQTPMRVDTEIHLRSRLPSLTGLRFIAAFSVFGLHIISGGIFSASIVNSSYFAFWQAGAAGVSYFFILSGFVLTWSSRTSDTTPRFWRRRVVKIFPNHLVTMGAAAIILAWVLKQTLDGRSAILNMLLLQSYSPDLSVRSDFNPVAWSLSCEMLFYLLFPLLLRGIRRIRPEKLWGWAIGTVVLIVVLAAAAPLLPTQTPYPTLGLTNWSMWLVYQFPPARLPEFVLGILLARIVLTGQRLPFGLRGATLFVVVMGASLPLFPGTYRAAAVMALPLGLLIAACAANDVEGRRSWLASRLMIWLGELSFAYYLWHYLVIEAVRQWLGSPDYTWPLPEAVGIAVLLCMITLALSWLLYRLVERPMMARFASPRLAPAPSAPSR